MSAVEAFLLAIDDAWEGSGPRVTLHVMGSTALMLQVDYDRGTKDSDVFQSRDLDVATAHQLRRLAGKGSALHQRHHIYLDVVPNGLPFLPQQPIWHPVPLNSRLKHFDLAALDVIDVIVSKFPRFSPTDRDDISAMVDRGLVPHDELIRRFRAAIDFMSESATASAFPRYVRNLHTAEINYFNVEPTAIELPSWI